MCLHGLDAGDVLVLDGLHRLRNDTLHSLHSLIYDRTLPLPDGSVVLPHSQFDGLVQQGLLRVVPPPPSSPLARTPSADPQMAVRADGSVVYRAHPAFRVLGLADGPVGGGAGAGAAAKAGFPCPETLGLFAYHRVPALTIEQQRMVSAAVDRWWLGAVMVEGVGLCGCRHRRCDGCRPSNVGNNTM